MNELIRSRGFRIVAVAEAIGVNRHSIGKWDRNTSIGKIMDLSRFTSIPLMEVIGCLVEDSQAIDPTRPNSIDPHRPAPIDPKLMEGENN